VILEDNKYINSYTLEDKANYNYSGYVSYKSSILVGSFQSLLKFLSSKSF